MRDGASPLIFASSPILMSDSASTLTLKPTLNLKERKRQHGRSSQQLSDPLNLSRNFFQFFLGHFLARLFETGQGFLSLP